MSAQVKHVDAPASQKLHEINASDLYAFVNKHDEFCTLSGAELKEMKGKITELETQAAQIEARIEKKRAELLRLVESLVDWANKQPAVADIHLWPAGRVVKIGLVTTGGNFDFDLCDASTEMQLLWHKDKLPPVEFLQMPTEAVARFVPPEFRD